MYWETRELPGIKGGCGSSLKMGIQLRRPREAVAGVMADYWLSCCERISVVA